MFLIRDIKYALRAIRSNLRLSLVIIFSIGVGIGLNVTVFSIFNAVLLRPLPGVKNSNQLVEVYTSYTGGMNFGAVSYPDFADWRDRNNGMQGLLAQDLLLVSLNRGDSNSVVPAALVSGNYFDVLGVKPSYGQFFTPQDAPVPGSSPVAVISYGMWKRDFGSDPGVIGRTIKMNARGFTVIGVAPSGFAGANMGIPLDIWIPLNMQPAFLSGNLLQMRDAHFLQVIGRLKPGVSIQQTSSMMDAVATQLGQQFPTTNRLARTSIVRLGNGPDALQSTLSSVVTVLMCVVLLVLLIACFNVANLLLARASARRGETALRLALGASGKRLMALFVTESIVLGLMGGAVALIMAYGATSIMSSFNPSTPVPIHLDLKPDNSVLLFAGLISVLAGVVVGLAPAIQAARSNGVTALRDIGFSRAVSKSWFRNALVVAQVAASILLLLSAGLMLRSNILAQKTDLGFEHDNLMVASIDVSLAGYQGQRSIQAYHSLLDRVKTIPGAASASLAQVVPLEVATTQQLGVVIDPRAQQRDTPIDYNIVSPGYFHTLKMPLLQGRDFTEQDNTGAPLVAIVNETFARKYYKGQQVIGNHFRFTGNFAQPVEIVGLAKDSKYYSIREEPLPFMYLPLWQHFDPSLVLHLRAAGDPAALLSSVRREVGNIDPMIPVFRVRSMNEQISTSLIELRLGAILLMVFGGMALLLATVGLYAVMAYSVDKRTREIGVYIALGAQRSYILAMILKQGLLLAVVGIVIGLGTAVPFSSVLRSLLYGVKPADPVILVGVVFLMGITALLASLVPAIKAMKLDPIHALRCE
jgi:putative ABC transport system permease protein